jgi:hypothetical protein
MHMKMDFFCYLSSQKMLNNLNSKGLEGQKWKKDEFEGKNVGFFAIWHIFGLLDYGSTQMRKVVN